jgi:signal transduction histidine kinase
VGAARLLALTGVYFVAGKLGLSLALVHASASPVWPPTGIALAAFLVLGRRVWPAIFAGAFLVNVTTEGNAATSIGIAVGNTLEGLAGAELLRWFTRDSAAFERPRSVFEFVWLAGLCATAISPTIGVTILCLGGFASWSAYPGIWLTWWLGDVGGATVVTPALVLWARQPRPGWTRRQWLEVAALAAVTAAAGAIAFVGDPLPQLGTGSLGFLCLPPAIWTAFRFGRRETATVVLILSGIAVWGVVRNTEAFPERENESLVLLQLFMGVVATTSLSLAAVVDERKRALEGVARQAAELARSNADLDEFARVVAHDLKAPLRAISSTAAWIAEDCKDVVSAESRDHLSMLEGSARRVTRMIDGVLGYSRVGRIRSAFALVEPRTIALQVIDSLRPPEGVSIRIEGRLPRVRYDPTQLAQIFQNLIQNGIQHLGSPTGEIVISGGENAHEFEFSVRDDGQGIPESHHDRIFQLFHVVDPMGHTTGVGLAIVRRIVETHGGSVSVTSSLRRGTTFRFSIPKGAE